MTDGLQEFRKNAPLVDIQELQKVVVEEILTGTLREQAEGVWLSGSFVDTSKPIDSGDEPSDLDVFVLDSEWELPVADTGIPIGASTVETPAYDAFADDEPDWVHEEKITPGYEWDRSAEEVWKRLPEYARETLKQSTKRGFFASEDDKENDIYRGYDVAIGNREQFEYGRNHRDFVELWNGND